MIDSVLGVGGLLVPLELLDAGNDKDPANSSSCSRVQNLAVALRGFVRVFLPGKTVDPIKEAIYVWHQCKRGLGVAASCAQVLFVLNKTSAHANK